MDKSLERTDRRTFRAHVRAIHGVDRLLTSRERARLDSIITEGLGLLDAGKRPRSVLRKLLTTLKKVDRRLDRNVELKREDAVRPGPGAARMRTR